MDYTTFTDKSLIKLLKSQNESDIEFAFETIYYKYAKLVHFCIYNIVKSEDDASDLTNDTFLSVFNNRERLIEEKNLKYYLLVSAKNKAFTFLKTKDCEIVHDDQIIDELLDDKVTSISIFEEMKQYLNDEEIKIIIMHVIYYMKFKDIANKLNQKQAKIKSIYYRALDKCKEYK